MEIKIINLFCYSFVGFVLLGILYLFFLRIVKTFMDFIDDSKYCLAYGLWYFKKKKEDLPPEILRRYLRQKDFEFVKYFRTICDELSNKKIGLKKVKYAELEKPFFIWHKRLFIKTDENNVIEVANGRTGKILGTEEVESIDICDKVIEISKILDLVSCFSEKLKEMGYSEIN